MTQDHIPPGLRRRELLAGLAGSGLWAAPALAAPKAFAGLDALAEKTAREIAAPAFSYGAVRRRTLTHARAFGSRQLGEVHAPVGPQTLFHMASVTKPFIATAAMQLVEAKRLTLATPVAALLPEIAWSDPRIGAITVQQLMSHTAGMPDVDDYGWDSPETDAGALARYVASLSNLTLLYAPGEGFAYSNIGYELLGRMLEVAARKPLETLVRDGIFRPLGMSGSTLFYPEADKRRLAQPYVSGKGGAVTAAPGWPYNRPHAASSTLISSAQDMLLWIRANLQQGRLGGARILSPAGMAALQAEVVMAPGAQVPFGRRRALGWFIQPTKVGPVLVHTGQDRGFVSLCLFDPSRGSGLVAMADLSEGLVMGRMVAFALQAVQSGLLAQENAQ